MDYRDFQHTLCNPGGFSPDGLLNLLQECTRACRNCHLAPPESRPPESGEADSRLADSGVVTGLGPASARLMIVGGESTEEDGAAGRPFAGEAGRLLQWAIARAGIGQPDVYMTNAVKHVGAHRLTQAVSACRQWVQGEMAVVKPEVVLCLGNVAAESVLGHQLELPRQRGRIFHPGFVPTVIVTVAASSLVDQPDTLSRDRALRDLVIELYKVGEVLGEFDPFRGREALAQL